MEIVERVAIETPASERATAYPTNEEREDGAPAGIEEDQLVAPMRIHFVALPERPVRKSRIPTRN
jgi:hypothetical protein